jgi:hypothetical protein
MELWRQLAAALKDVELSCITISNTARGMTSLSQALLQIK